MREVVKKMYCVDVWDTDGGRFAAFEHPFDTDSIVVNVGKSAPLKGKMYEIVVREPVFDA